jgi:hypothetical protein
VAIPIAAEERVIRALMNSLQPRADFPANIANVMEQTLQLQLSSVRVRDYASTATPGAVEIESSYFIDHQAGPSP